MPPSRRSAHALVVDPAADQATDASSRALALAAAARSFRASKNHAGAEAAYRRALAVLGDANIPTDHDAQQTVHHDYAAFLVELGRDREAAALEREVVTHQPNASKGRTSCLSQPPSS